MLLWSVAEGFIQVRIAYGVFWCQELQQPSATGVLYMSVIRVKMFIALAQSQPFTPSKSINDYEAILSASQPTNQTMPVYHVALFKLKPEADPNKVKQWQALAEGMVGQVPGSTSTPCISPRRIANRSSRPYRSSGRRAHCLDGTHGKGL